MKRINVFIIAALSLLLVAGITMSAAANTTPPVTDSPAPQISEVEPEVLVEDYEELIPIPEDGREVSINGGFKGVWGFDNSTTDKPPATLAGIYGRVVNADGTTHGYFGGFWKTPEGTVGYLTGKWGNGYFWGTWRCLESGRSGPVGGIYTPSTNDSAEVVRRFTGKWATSSGEVIGYLKGTWSPAVEHHREGRFGGYWTYNPDVTAADITPDGKLQGIYESIRLADGTTMHLFKGRGFNNEGTIRGTIIGLAANDDFCGLWKTLTGNAHGYLKGVWRNNQFKGVWGHFGHSSIGRLWGRYGPTLTPETAEPEVVQKEPVVSKLAVPSPQIVRKQPLSASAVSISAIKK